MFGDFPVQNKIVLVTGGGSGIGLKFCRLVCAKGAKVLLADIQLTREAEELVQAEPNVVFQRCDVRRWKELTAAIQACETHWGDVPDVYAPVAGIFEPKWSNFWEDTETDGYGSVDINVNHPIKLTRLALRSLLGRNKKGVVCIIASIAGILGSYGTPIYCATKHAIVGFVKSLAASDEREGVKVVAVCPSFVNTPLWTDAPDRVNQYTLESAKMLAPEAVADGMVSIIENGQYGGGTLLEMNATGQRVLPEWNMSPPDIGYHWESEDMEQRYLAPIQNIMSRERRGTPSKL
ncbi:hypothetical protein FE257_002209 [Aspergillus nanangensis]|uniref:NAD(P)-binding protein n=1 Tax=Aspergillus nanangensis TaxID=2582783 RepID=A0AAD4GQB5_ASPNN|nr:hypothetical protein FE257_002209 [Aspergillus nanangensis]